MKPLCPNCSSELPALLANGREEALCPFCGVTIMLLLYPAAFRVQQQVSLSPAVAGEAACYFHAQKTAAASCSQCGRFLCTLCQTEVKAEIWCPECLTSGVKKARISSLETQRTLHDSIALNVAVLPFLAAFWPSLLGAPAALFLAIRGWTRPLSLVRRSRWRLVLAVVLALVQVAVWLSMLYFLVRTRRGIA